MDRERRARLRDRLRDVLAISEGIWTYVDGPTLGDVHVQTRPLNPGRSKIRLDPDALGPYLVEVSPLRVSELLDELDAAERSAALGLKAMEREATRRSRSQRTLTRGTSSSKRRLGFNSTR